MRAIDAGRQDFIVFAIKNFIFHNLYKEFMSATKALNKPLAQLDFKPLSNEIKALPYKANANLKAHLRDINAKTNDFLDSMQELKKTTKEIKLLPYNKPSENEAVEVDRFRNVLDSKLMKSNIINRLENIQAEPTPKQLTQSQIENVLQRFDNMDNLMQRLNTRHDSKARLGLFHLLDSTMQNPHIQYTKDSKDKYLKKFIDLHSNKDPFFYLLVTKENDKKFITHLKTRDMDYLANEIESADNIVKGTDIIGVLRQQAGAIQRIMETPAPKQQNPTTKQEISKDIESKSTQDNTQWQQFIHNALPNELKHYEKLNEEQLNKIKEAEELDKDIFFSRWHNHPKVLETIKVKTKDNKEVEVLKTLHKDGNIKYYEPLSATEADINKFKDIDLQTYKQAIIENVGENQAKIFDIVARLNSRFFNAFEKELLYDVFRTSWKVMQKHETIESASQTTKEIETPFNKDNSPYDAQTTQRKKELVDNIFQYVIEHDALEDSQHYMSMADNREKEQIKKLKPYPPPLP
ncbi:hypothetical protein [Helicobacter bilis]|uniref:hypothetical protein n=1 Tax=Helicobacter bilis TaxID=37372 RepID=UPI00248EFD93|nr:hypothetical protein [Helicobacter bilis]